MYYKLVILSLFLITFEKRREEEKKETNPVFNHFFFYRRKSINLFCTLFYIKPIQFLTVLLIFLVACVQTCQVVAHPEPVDIHHG